MSGIFTRRNYDDCFQRDIIKTTTKPGHIVLEPSVNTSNKTCYSLNSPHPTRSRNNSDMGLMNYQNLVNLENYLLNLDIPDSKCLKINTLQEKDKRLKAEAKKYNANFKLTDCSNDISTKYSRLNSNINMVKELPYNRYEFPIIDPYEFVYYGINNTKQIGNNRAGISTRIDIKDSLTNDINKLKKVLVK